MKFKFLLTLTLAGASALGAWAQGYKDGVEYFKADRLTDAEELLNRNLNNADTNKAEAYYYLGQIQLARYYSVKMNNSGDPAKYKAAAADLFNKGIAADAENPFNYVGIGNIELINNNSKAAQDNFKQAEKLAKKDAGVYAAIARAYYDVNPTLYAKQMDKALQAGNKLVQKQALSKDPQWADHDSDFYMLMGDMEFDAANGDSKEVGDACNFYEQAIRVNPKAAEGYIKYADKLFTVKRNNEALAQLRTLLENNPMSALGQRELAERLYNEGKVQEGIEEYGKLIRNPNHFAQDENRYMGLLYFVDDNQKGYDEATYMLNLDPTNFNARRSQYVFASRMGRPSALQLAEELLKLKSKDNPFATGDYALIAGDLIKAGRNDEAAAVLDMGIADYPDQPAVYKGAANVYLFNLKQYAKAADAMAKVVEFAANDATASDYNSLSDFAYYAAQTVENDADKAKYISMSEDAIKKAASGLAEQYKYLAPKRIGDLARIKKDTKTTLDNYQTAIKMIETVGVNDNNKGDLSTMYRMLGLQYIADKNYPEAKAYLQKYMGLNPDDAEMAKLISQLK
ncbi:MAG: tetratricopeptide repeat protein [Prevotella sp.]|nr:tetratricopeptide repeat protein [Prevotella sp.]MCM1074599.1 tetratricopeptide repeat protein [Ruminococcus sp.]